MLKFNGMAELLAKYQKLATEFSKVRAQVVVLKKAVIDEQASNADLKSQLRSSEQTSRKLEQEVEGVSFRNQQLESRVLVLQVEIEQLNGKKKKTSTHTTTTSPQLDILNEELSNKLNENVSLHIKLNQTEEQCRTEIEAIKSKLRQSENDLESNQSQLKDSESRLKAIQSELRDSNEEASVSLSKVRDLEGKLVQSQSKFEEFESNSTFKMAEILSETDALKKKLEEVYKDVEEEKQKYQALEAKRGNDLKEFKDEMEWRDKVVKDKELQLQNLATKTTTKPTTTTATTQTSFTNLKSSTTQTTTLTKTSSSTQILAIATSSTTTQTIKTNVTASKTTQTTIQQQHNDNFDKITCLQTKLMDSEMDKEHWSLQAQLMTAKYKHEVQKLDLLQANNNTTTPLLPSNKNEVNDDDNDNRHVYGLTLNSDLGDIKIKDCVESGPRTEGDLIWDEERERIIVQHFEGRLGRGVVCLHETQATANHYQMESRALNQQLTYLRDERDRLVADLDRTNHSMRQLKDELNTTSSNYESQLSLMSDHLASINEKMVSQKEEIDTLTFQLHTPSNTINKNNTTTTTNNGTQSRGLLRKGKF